MWWATSCLCRSLPPRPNLGARRLQHRTAMLIHTDTPGTHNPRHELRMPDPPSMGATKGAGRQLPGAQEQPQPWHVPTYQQQCPRGVPIMGIAWLKPLGLRRLSTHGEVPPVTVPAGMGRKSGAGNALNPRCQRVDAVIEVTRPPDGTICESCLPECVLLTCRRATSPRVRDLLDEVCAGWVGLTSRP